MPHGFLIKAGSMVAALVLLAACADEPPATDASDAGSGGNTQVAAPAPAPAPAPRVVATPSGPKEGSQEHFVLNVGDRVFFGFDRHDLNSDAQAVLRRQAAYLARYPSKTVVVEGHADERGTREYNLGLGERRANSAKEYLVSLGIAPSRIATISYGKERPVALSHNESGWAQNRRSVTVIAN
ncbi:MAG: peptidoglycan-associated lipoprotein Pal [Minwuia sp.]|nr:peptidoglycan-associated lipoprotein Pal [Minwuia sp.]